jgi:hypothetical protein
MRMKSGAAVLVAAALAGCSTVSDTIGDPYAAPGKFQYLRCDDIMRRITNNENREKELHKLMDRSSAGLGGGAVNVFVYGPDLESVEADLRQLRVTAGEKRCADEPVRGGPKADLPPVH